MDVLLAINAAELDASEPDAVVTIRSLGAGEVTEDGLVQWVKADASST